jgi:hypothetical protein
MQYLSTAIHFFRVNIISVYNNGFPPSIQDDTNSLFIYRPIIQLIA